MRKSISLSNIRGIWWIRRVQACIFPLNAFAALVLPELQAAVIFLQAGFAASLQEQLQYLSVKVWKF